MRKKLNGYLVKKILVGGKYKKRRKEWIPVCEGMTEERLGMTEKSCNEMKNWNDVNLVK